MSNPSSPSINGQISSQNPANLLSGANFSASSKFPLGEQGYIKGISINFKRWAKELVDQVFLVGNPLENEAVKRSLSSIIPEASDQISNKVFYRHIIAKLKHYNSCDNLFRSSEIIFALNDLVDTLKTSTELPKESSINPLHHQQLPSATAKDSYRNDVRFSYYTNRSLQIFREILNAGAMEQVAPRRKVMEIVSARAGISSRSLTLHIQGRIRASDNYPEVYQKGITDKLETLLASLPKKQETKSTITRVSSNPRKTSVVKVARPSFNPEKLNLALKVYQEIYDSKQLLNDNSPVRIALFKLFPNANSEISNRNLHNHFKKEIKLAFSKITFAEQDLRLSLLRQIKDAIPEKPVEVPKKRGRPPGVKPKVALPNVVLTEAKKVKTVIDQPKKSNADIIPKARTPRLFKREEAKDLRSPRVSATVKKVSHVIIPQTRTPRFVRPLPTPVVSGTPIDLALGKNYLGESAYQSFGGKIGKVPPLPSSLTLELLNTPCPFRPGYRILDTHVLCLIPDKVNGEPFHIFNALQMIQPKYSPAIIKEADPIDTSHPEFSEDLSEDESLELYTELTEADSRADSSVSKKIFCQEEKFIWQSAKQSYWVLLPMEITRSPENFPDYRPVRALESFIAGALMSTYADKHLYRNRVGIAAERLANGSMITVGSGEGFLNINSTKEDSLSFPIFSYIGYGLARRL